MQLNLNDFFFNNERLIRLSTDETPLAKSPQRELKQTAQTQLKEEMSSFREAKPTASLTELAYAYHRGVTAPPVCRTCGAVTKFGRSDWAMFCNARCQMSAAETKISRLQAALGKWGVTHQFNRPDVVAKKQATFDYTRACNAKLKAEQAAAKALSPAAIKERQKVEARAARAQTQIQRYGSAGFSDLVLGKKQAVLEAKHECGEIVRNPRWPVQCYVCCAPAKETAQWQFSNQLSVPFERNKRVMGGKFQLDAYWPEHSLAIEYNGLYWHSSAPKPGAGRTVDRLYHQEKMLAAKSEGIRLLTVWEDRARDPTFVKHFIWLLQPKTNLNGRQCTVTGVSSKDATAFLTEHHRDRSVKGASISLGLEHQGELVMIATFGRNRFKGEGFELYRLATKTGVIVRGGVSKLISAFRKNQPGKLTTYADASWGWGEGYIKAGGTLVGLSKPGYFYFNQKDGNRIHRLALSKGNFEKTTGLAWDPNLKEAENAARAKCWQVWDCGNWKFEWLCTLEKSSNQSLVT